MPVDAMPLQNSLNVMLSDLRPTTMMIASTAYRAIRRGIVGVGRSGFFTMSTQVVNTWPVVHAHCFAQLDGAQLRRELTGSIPPFRQHWEAALSAMDARRAPGRMTLTPAVAFDPLCEFFTYGTLRTAVGFKGFDSDADAPRVRFGFGTEGDIGTGDDLEGSS